MTTNKHIEILDTATDLLGLHLRVKSFAIIRPDDAEELELARTRRTHHIQSSGWFKFKRIVDIFKREHPNNNNIHADRVNIGTPDNPEELFLARGYYHTVVRFIETHGLDEVAHLDIEPTVNP